MRQHSDEHGWHQWPEFVGIAPVNRYWELPLATEELIVFANAMLDALSPWDSCWVFKWEAVWLPDIGEGAEGLERLLHSLGIPADYGGAVRFTQEERAELALLLVTQIAFGMSSSSYFDVWIIPSHARQFIRTDDDAIIGAHFRDEATLAQFVRGMRAWGFPLSMEPPSGFIYWQPWMGPKPAGYPSEPQDSH